MDLEMLMVEILNDLIDEFADKFKQLTTENVNQIGTTFKEIGDAVTWYNEALTQHMHSLLEKQSHGDVSENADVIALLSDRDSAINAVTASNDNHVAFMQRKEDFYRDSESKEGADFETGIRQAEYNRNRHRVTEIHELIRSYNVAIDQKLDFESLEEDDYRYDND